MTMTFNQPDTSAQEIRAIAGSFGADVSAVDDVDNRLKTLERIVSLPEPKRVPLDSPNIEAAIKKFADATVSVAAQREAARVLVPSAQDAVRRVLTRDVLPKLVDTVLVPEFDVAISRVRELLDSVGHLAPADLAGVDLTTFQNFQSIQAASHRCDLILGARQRIAEIVGEQTSFLYDGKGLSTIPVLAADVNGPTDGDNQTLKRWYTEVMQTFGKDGVTTDDAVSRWRRVLKLEQQGTLEVSLTRHLKCHERIARFQAFDQARWALERRG